MIEIGAVVGWGSTLEEAVEHAREAGESIKGYGIKFNMGPIDTVNKAIEELVEIGISPFKMDKEEKQSKPD
jgi:superfamily I DNA and/or RNA helicase